MGAEPDAPSARPTLADLISRLQELADYTVPLAIRAVCELRIADLVAEAPLTVAELAAITGAHEATLHRTLRALSCKGIFTEVEPGRFGLTRLAGLLRTDHPLSHREGYPLLRADVEAWASFLHTMRTGGPAFTHVHGASYYDWLDEHPAERERFDRSVRCQNRLVIRGLIAAYDWAGCGILVDVGSGDGAFIAGLLRRYQTLRGIVFDRESALAAAPAVLRDAGVAERCTIVAGSFFDAVPPGADVYMLKTILHDWDDADAAALLRVVRTAMRPDSRLLILEPLFAADDEFHIGKIMDLHSLVLVQNRDRDLAAFERLLTAGDLRLVRTIPTATLSIMESVPC